MKDLTGIPTWQTAEWSAATEDLRVDEALAGRQVFVLLPALNEEEGLEKLLRRIAQVCDPFGVPWRAVVVNDGSSDRTRTVLRSLDSLPITVVDFPERRGLESALKAGFGWILNHAGPSDLVVTMDGDNTHTPYAIIDILRVLTAGADLVIASRFQPGGGMVGVPWYRRIISAAATWLLTRLIALPNVTDYSTLYRGYRVALLQRGFERYGDRLVSGVGFSVVPALLMRLGAIAGSIREVPLKVRYDLKEGRSGLPFFRTVWGYFRLLRGYARERKALR